MAEPLIQPEIYAVIGAALFGALLGQFFSFYRQKRQDFEELKSILRLISLFDQEEIRTKIDQEHSFPWYLREELFQSYKSNILYLGESAPSVLKLIREFPSPDIDKPSGYLNEDALIEGAETAYNQLDRINPARMLWLTILGFLGISQEEHGNAIDEFLDEGEVPKTTTELDIEPGTLPPPPIGSKVGYIVPISRMLKIGIVWFFSVLLIIAAAVGIFLTGTFTRTIEIALAGSLFMLVIGFFVVYSVITFMGQPVTSLEGEESEKFGKSK